MTKEFLQYTGFCAPIISSLSCAMMLVIHRRTYGKSEDNILYRLLIIYFFAISLLWACSLVYVYFPRLYVHINVIYYLGLFWGQVVFYQFIYTLTRLPGEKAFSRIHYLVPLLIVGVFTVWSAFVPFEWQVYIVTSRGEFAPGYEAYSRLFTSRLIFRGIWNILYTVLAWWRLLAYRRNIADYSSNAGRSSLSWVTLLLVLSLSLVPPSLLSAIFPKKVLISSIMLLLPQLLLVLQHAIVCYNMAVGNFVVIRYPEGENSGDEDGKEKEERPNRQEEDESRRSERRRKFEKYMHEHRPYLNPELRITDLIPALRTNRTHLSRFINREFGMNFSRYINMLRLQEMEALRNDRSCAHLSEEERACMAGFGSFRGYIRVKRMIDQEEKKCNRKKI